MHDLQNFETNFVFFLSRLAIWFAVRIFLAVIIFNNMLFLVIAKLSIETLP